MKLKKDRASQQMNISDMTREELEQFIEIEKICIKCLMKEARSLMEMVNYMADRFNIKLEEEEEKN